MWLIIALGVALSEAAKDVYMSRRKFSMFAGLKKAWILAITSLPLLFLKLWYDGIPKVAPEFWLYSISHSLILIVALTLHMRAITLGHLSQVQPMLAMTGVFLILTNPLMTNDQVTILGWVGVFVVALGIWATQHPGKDSTRGWISGFFAPCREMVRTPGVGSMLGAAALYSITANLDRLALNASSASWYATMDLVTVGAVLGVYLLIQYLRKGVSVPSEYGHGMRSPRSLLLGGCINATTFLLHMWALTFTAVPYLISVRRSSIIFASLWGYLVRRERPPHWYRIVGMILVVMGIAIILLYGRQH